MCCFRASKFAPKGQFRLQLVSFLVSSEQVGGTDPRYLPIEIFDWTLKFRLNYQSPKIVENRGSESFHQYFGLREEAESKI